MVTRKSFEPKKVLLPRRLCPAIPNPILPTGLCRIVIALPGHGCMEGESSGLFQKGEGTK